MKKKIGTLKIVCYNQKFLINVDSCLLYNKRIHWNFSLLYLKYSSCLFQGILLVCKESDVEFFADCSDSDSNNSDNELTEAVSFTHALSFRSRVFYLSYKSCLPYKWNGVVK